MLHWVTGQMFFFWRYPVVKHLEFAAVDGTLRQFAASARQSAIRHAARALPDRYLIDAMGTAQDSWDPAWLMAEDCVQSPVGYGGVTYWEPDLVEARAGQAVALVVEAYDMARRVGLRVMVPMVAGRKNPLLRTPAGPESVTEIPVPEVSEPRYENWDLATFARWAEAELVRGGAGARKLATYKATARILAQKYAEIAEYSGFAYIDRWRSEREAAKRTGQYWLGQAKSHVWKAGEQGASEQLLALARDKTGEEDPKFAFTAIWWSQDGLTQARFTELASRQEWTETWSITLARGISNLALRALGINENVVTRVTPPGPAG